MSKIDVQRLRDLLAKAFRTPWTADTWEVYCDKDADDDCGYEHTVETILSKDEYPHEEPGQVVAQVSSGCVKIETPGMEEFAKANAALITAAVNALPALLDELERLLPVRHDTLIECARIAQNVAATNRDVIEAAREIRALMESK